MQHISQSRKVNGVSVNTWKSVYICENIWFPTFIFFVYVCDNYCPSGEKKHAALADRRLIESLISRNVFLTNFQMKK